MENQFLKLMIWGYPHFWKPQDGKWPTNMDEFATKLVMFCIFLYVYPREDVEDLAGLGK